MSGGPDACWPWTAYRRPTGYGGFQVENNCERAHRIAWEIMVGAIPVSMHVLHSCDNPSCVNSKHLFLGTQVDNNADMVKKGRQARGNKNGRRTHPEATARGERVGRAKLTESDVLAIRAIGRTVNQRNLGAIYGVNHATVGAVLRRQTWTHLPLEGI